MKNTILGLMVFIQFGCANDNYYYNNNKKTTLTKSSSMSRNASGIDYYQNDNGTDLGVTDKLIVKLKDVKNLKNYLVEFNLIEEKKMMENLYLLKASSKKFTIDIANRLNEKDDVEYSHPDFIKKRLGR